MKKFKILFCIAVWSQTFHEIEIKFDAFIIFTIFQEHKLVFPQENQFFIRKPVWTIENAIFSNSIDLISQNCKNFQLTLWVGFISASFLF